MKLDDKVFIITGAAEGIGHSIARLFAANNAKLMLADLEKPELQLQNSVSLKYNPLSLSESVGLVKETLNHFENKIDGIVNALSTCIVSKVSRLDVESWDYQMDFNFKSVFFLNQAIAKHMIKQGRGGTFINLITTAALTGTDQISVYSASQAALMNLSQTMALELKQYNIRSNSIIVPYIDDVVIKNGELFKGKDLERIRRVAYTFSPMMDLIEPEQVAQITLFLASNDSLIINGQNIGIIDDDLTNIRNILSKKRLKS
ncbi:MAG: SDR family NAD(P)-dependent oxidoreductase [Candidatus Heimdallarchaeota archaeon]